MSPNPKQGYEPPLPLSKWWIVVLLVTVSCLVAYGLIDEALKAGKPAKIQADAAYVARVPAVGATASGSTPDKAVRAAAKAAAALVESGDVQPERNDVIAGRFPVRGACPHCGASQFGQGIR